MFLDPKSLYLVELSYHKPIIERSRESEIRSLVGHPRQTSAPHAAVSAALPPNRWTSPLGAMACWQRPI